MSNFTLNNNTNTNTNNLSALNANQNLGSTNNMWANTNSNMMSSIESMNSTTTVLLQLIQTILEQLQNAQANGNTGTGDANGNTGSTGGANGNTGSTGDANGNTGSTGGANGNTGSTDTTTTIAASIENAFNGAAGADSILQMTEFTALVNNAAGTDGELSQAEFVALGSNLGMTEEQATATFNALSDGADSISVDVVVDFATSAAGKDDSLTLADFNTVVTALVDEGVQPAPAPTPVDNTAIISAFNGAAGADNILQMTEFSALVNNAAGADGELSQAEFVQLGASLGMTEEQATATFNALSEGADTISVNVVINLATDAADKGNLTEDSFVELVNSLIQLGQPTDTDGTTINTGDGDDVVNTAGGNDTVATQDGDDTVDTGNGNDIINAGPGNDVINAGAGNDTITGGEGNDQFIAGAGDTIVLPNGQTFVVGEDGELTTPPADDANAPTEPTPTPEPNQPVAPTPTPEPNQPVAPTPTPEPNQPVEPTPTPAPAPEPTPAPAPAPAPRDPLAIDLNGSGAIETTGASTAKDRVDTTVGETVSFDIDGDGNNENIEWLSGSGDGFLVDNRDGQAASDMDGTRLFGDDNGRFSDGLEKLAQHDANNDGQISGDELEGLSVWVDDGDAKVEEGEMMSAQEAGITSVSTQRNDITNESGETLMRSTAEINGETVMTEDVWFAEKA